MTLATAIEPIVTRLDAASIPYMLVGSTASSLHGELRATQDVDIVIDPSRPALATFLASVPDRYYVDRDVAFEALARRSMFNLIELEWAKLGASARQLDDVRRLVGVRGDTLDRAYVARWVGELGLDAQWAEAEGE